MTNNLAKLGWCGLLMTSACSVVAPYQRETLARPDMTLSAHAEIEAGEQHARSYREGSSGGGAARGGGCGCN